jgi:hypothetical protein
MSERAAKRWRLKSIIHGIARTGPYRAGKVHRTGADLTETNPKNLSGRMSDPANMRGRGAVSPDSDSDSRSWPLF